jgi:hypothetical protein
MSYILSTGISAGIGVPVWVYILYKYQQSDGNVIHSK